MFKKAAANLVVYPMMALVLILQVYFAMIIMTVSALAQDTAVESQLPKNNQGAVDTRIVNQKPEKNSVDLKLNEESPLKKSYELSSEEVKERMQKKLEAYKRKNNITYVDKDTGEKKFLVSSSDDEDDVVEYDDKRNLQYQILQLIKKKLKNGEDPDNLENLAASIHHFIIEDKAKRPPPSESETFYKSLEDILVPIVLFLSIAFAFIAKYYFKYKSRQNYLDLVKLSVEKGQPIPSEVSPTGETQTRTWQDEMGRGIKFVLVGLGMALFFQTVGGPWAIGAIFTFIGLGQLGAAYIKKNNQPTK